MIVTTKQIRIFASITVSLAWLFYAAFSYGLISYPLKILGNPVNYWSLPAVWTIIMIGIILIDQYGAGETLGPAIWFLMVFIALAFLLGLALPYAGVGLDSAEILVCYASCAALAINWVGGVGPVVAGTTVMVIEIYMHGASPLRRRHVRYWFAVVSAFLMIVLFHDVSSLGVATDSRFAGLAALPVFFIVHTTKTFRDPGGAESPASLTSRREIIWNALVIYSVLAIVFFLADLVALPLLLAPMNSVNDSIWTIGANGMRDGNFFFPLTAMISYPASQFLLMTATRARSRVKRTPSKHLNPS
jgi:hypothetical protein